MLERVLVVLLSALLLIVLVLQIGAVRELVLTRVLDRALRQVPGHLAVEVSWPRLSRIEATDLLWTLEGDTLVCADEIAVACRLRELVAGDVYLPELVVAGTLIDVPALNEALAAMQSRTSPDPVAAPADRKPPTFPRTGALPPVPSVGVCAVAVDVAEIRLDENQRLADLTLRLSLELRRDRAAHLSLDTLRVRSVPEAWAVTEAALDVQPLAGIVAGRVRAALTPDQRVAVDLESAGKQRFGVALSSRAGQTEPATDLRGEVSYRTGDQPSARVRFAGMAGGRQLDLVQMDVAVDASRFDSASPATFRGPVTSVLRIIANDLDVITAARANIDAARADSVLIELAPVNIATATAPPFAAREHGPYGGQLVVHTDGSGQASLVDWTITGALGDYRLAGEATPDGGAARLQARWTQPPQLLASAFVGSTADSLADSLAVHWPVAPEPGLDLQVGVERRADVIRGRLRGSFDLPGPRNLAALLPPELRVDDLGPLHGVLEGRFDRRPDREPTYVARLDLTGTEWLTDGRLTVHGSDGVTNLDSVRLALPGLTIEATGWIAAEDFDLAGAIEIPDASLLTRWPGLARADDALQCRLEWSASGPAEQPALAATLSAAGALAAVHVPQLDGHSVVRDDSLNVTLTMPDGIRAGTVAFDAVDAALSVSDLLSSTAARDSSGAVFPSTRFRVGATGEDLTVMVGGGISGGQASRPADSAPLALQLDTVMFKLLDGTLTARRPVALAFDPQTGVYEINSLELAGSLGEIVASGAVSSERLQLDAGVDLHLPLAALEKLAPSEYFPRQRGLELGLSGQVALRGDAANPAARLRLETGLMGDEDLAPLRLLAGAVLEPNAAAIWPAGLATLDEVGPGSMMVTRGVGAAFSLLQGDTTLVNGWFGYPARVTLQPAAVAVAAGDTITARIESRMLRLADFQRFLPASVSVDGQCRLALAASGTGELVRLSGEIDLPSLRTELADGSWAVSSGHMELTGTSAEPHVTGAVTLEGGVIKLPPVPPALLPTGGDALLWAADSLGTVTMADTLGTAASTDTDVPAGAQPAAATQPTASSAALDVAVTLDCPGNFWLRGNGLEVELAGDLEVTQQDDPLPVVVGELTAIQGSLKFLARNFVIERGKIAFFGDLESDPVLDLALSSRIEGTTYRIQVTGPARKPELDLSSDPEMSEGDIIASLLFGKPLDQLDSGQENLLQERARQILAAFSAVALQDQLSTSLGVDLITYNQAAAEDESDSLIIGKYLSPRALLKYEQIFGYETAFFVRLDYTLNRALRVETSVGQGAPSGVELKWAREY